MTSCVYKIRNIKTGQSYIGGAVKFERRRAIHISQLKKNIHPNKKLQQAWNEYGESNFEFFPVEIMESSENVPAREQQWINNEKSDDGYNCMPTANGGKREGAGRKPSPLGPTKAIRVPVALIPKIEKLVEEYKLTTPPKKCKV